MVRLRFILPMPIWSPPTPNCCVSCCARVREPPFNGVIGYDALRSLKRELRMYFVQFCHKTPALAAEVFAACQKTGSHGHETASAIFKSSGQLAIAAPEALAELAWRALVPAPVKHRDRFFPPERREPFTYVDHDLLNVSPAQDPFLNLLEHAPHMGLGLVRRLGVPSPNWTSRRRANRDFRLPLAPFVSHTLGRMPGRATPTGTTASPAR
jgi:hypothetical protein